MSHLLAVYTATDDLAITGANSAILPNATDTFVGRLLTGNYQTLIYFPSIDIPIGAEITRARLRATPSDTYSGPGAGVNFVVDLVQDEITAQLSSALAFARHREVAPTPFSLIGVSGIIATESATAAPSIQHRLSQTQPDYDAIILTTSSDECDRITMQMRRQNSSLTVGSIRFELHSLPGDDITSQTTSGLLAFTDSIAVSSIPTTLTTMTFNFTGDNRINLASGRPVALRLASSGVVWGGVAILFVSSRVRDLSVIASATGNANITRVSRRTASIPFVADYYPQEGSLPAVNNGNNYTRILQYVEVDGSAGMLTLSNPAFTIDVAETWGDAGFLIPSTRQFAGGPAAFAAALQLWIDRPEYLVNRPLTLVISQSASGSNSLPATFYSIHSGIAGTEWRLEVEYETEDLDVVTIWTDVDADPSDTWTDISADSGAPSILCEPLSELCTPTGEICEAAFADADADAVNTVWTDTAES